MPKKKKSTKLSSNQKIGIGIGLTAAAVAAAGTYFLYGSKNASKNRKKVKSWMFNAKAEVLEKLEEAKEMSQEEYEDLINTVAATYAELKNASRIDIKSFKDEMKEHWQAIEKNAQPNKKPAKKSPKKTTKTAAKKKPVKKVTKKVAKKPTKKTTKK